MRILTVEESVDWLAERHVRMEPAREWGHDHHLEIPEAFHTFYFDTPRDARTVWSLAHLLCEWIPCQSSLLVITVAALFDAHELDAFLLPRRSLGETRWIDGVPGGATPGHLFGDDPGAARRDARELLSLMMAYSFQGYLITADGATIVWIGNEVVDIETRDEGELDTARGIAGKLELQAGGWAHELMSRRARRWN